MSTTTRITARITTGRAAPGSSGQLVPSARFQLRDLAIIGILIPVAAGKWGSYISLPNSPVFVADTLVALGVTSHLISLAFARNRATVGRVGRGPLISSVVLLGAAMLWAANANWNSSVFLVIRDIAPVAYLAMTPIFVQIMRSFGAERAWNALALACATHTIWFFSAAFRLIGPVSIEPFSRLPAFTTRGDFDLLICALSVCVFIAHPRLTGVLKFTLAGLALISLLAGGSRSGLIAGSVLILLASILVRRRGYRIPPIGVAGIWAAIAALIPSIAVIYTDPPAWMKGFSRLFDEGSAEQASAINTWQARIYAWQRVFAYGNVTPERALWGTGAGSQPIFDSGAVQFLSGNAEVRAAHNAFVTWFALFGMVGACLLTAAILIWLLAALRSSIRSRGLAGIGVALSVGICLSALGGVILESPFGYMVLILGLSLAFLREPTPNELKPADLRPDK